MASSSSNPNSDMISSNSSARLSEIFGTIRRITLEPDMPFIITVMDSPYNLVPPASAAAAAAAIIVPDGLENDWKFSTYHGMAQIMLSQAMSFSRLFIIAKKPQECRPRVYRRLPDNPLIRDDFYLLLKLMCPPTAFPIDPQITFLPFIYDVVQGSIIILEVRVQKGESFRRLRFLGMPNFIQTQIQIPRIDDTLDGVILAPQKEGQELDIELQLLTSVPPTLSETIIRTERAGDHKNIPAVVATTGSIESTPYLVAMAASLSLIAHTIDQVESQGTRLSALCLGVGGGVLLGFLRSKLDFDVVGVEMDPTVLQIARDYFGLPMSSLLRLVIGDAIELIHELSKAHKNGLDFISKKLSEALGNRFSGLEGVNTQYNIIMVDLVSNDAGTPMAAPPLTLVTEEIFKKLRSLMIRGGILVIHCISPDEIFYNVLIQGLQAVFPEVYRIDLSSGGTCQFVISALQAPEGPFMQSLRKAISGAFLGPIVRF